MKRSSGRRESLLRRAVLSNMMLVAASGALLAAMAIHVESRALDEQLALRAGAVAEFLARQGQFGLLIGSKELLDQVATSAMSVEDVLFVEIRDRSGRPLAAHGMSRIGNAQFLDMVRSVEGPATGGLLDWEAGAAPKPRLGSVRIGFSTARQREARRKIVTLGLAAAVICLLLVFTAQYVQMKRLLRPLAGLIGIARQVEKGNLSARAMVERPDEVGELAAAFNQMMQELRSTLVSRDYVNNILQSMDESMIVVGEDGRIQTANRAALELLGYGESELIGQPGAMVLAGAAPGGWVQERVYRLRGGKEIPVLFSAAPLPGSEAGKEVWLARDISERKRVEEELREARRAAEQASQAKSDLLSRTSHELRTPLNAILGFGQLLELSDLAAEDAESVAQIMKGGRHLLKLVNEVLDIAGIEAGRRTMSIEPVGIRDAVVEAVNLVAPLAREQGIELAVRESADLDCAVVADRLRLQQVLLNLLSNAVKYNRPGGSVAARCDRAADGKLRILVSDSGMGIPPEGLERLFIPFERLGAEARNVEGTGLGLVWARSFAEAMGGSLGVASVVGEGSTFWIALPECAAAAGVVALDDAYADDASDTGSYKLLYVEDNVSNRTLMERVLQRRPAWTLVTAHTGPEGVAAAREMKPDLILLDLHLPGIWGDEVLQLLRTDPPVTCPIVMLSADVNPAQIERLLAMGADEYLSKPVDIPKLLRVLDETLKKGAKACRGPQLVS